MSYEDILVIYCTCPNSHSAQLAEQLIETQLAACVNINQNVRSVYRWQGTIAHELEDLLLIKSCKTAYKALESLIKSKHPYECPEIIAMPLIQGYPPYITWLQQNIQGT